LEFISFYGSIQDDRKGPKQLNSYYSARMPEDRAVTFKRSFEQQRDLLQDKLDSRIAKVVLCDGHHALWNYADDNG